MKDWNGLLDRVASTEPSPLRPQMVIRAVSDLLADAAIVSLDCGANTHFAARFLSLRQNQRLTGTGMLASMAPGLPFAIAAQLAYPERQSVALVGDGGFAMLMAELTTAVAHKMPERARQRLKEHSPRQSTNYSAGWTFETPTMAFGMRG